MKDPRLNDRWGRYCEWAARLRYGLERSRGCFHDVVGPDGRLGEVKSCRERVGAREDAGKYFIRRENHEKLLDEGGFYVFIVYNPEYTGRKGPVMDMVKRPAEYVETELEHYSWTANGSRRGEIVKRPPWTALFGEK